MRRFAAAILVLGLLTLALAACGNGKKSSSSDTGGAVQATNSATETASGGDPEQQDALVKSALRNFVTEVETCFVDQMDYSQCKQPAGTKLDIGSGPGQVELSAAGSATYTAAAHSESGNTFKIEKQSNGGVKRTCEQPDTGGCNKDGTW